MYLSMSNSESTQSPRSFLHFALRMPVREEESLMSLAERWKDIVAVLYRSSRVCGCSCCVGFVVGGLRIELICLSEDQLRGAMLALISSFPSFLEEGRLSTEDLPRHWHAMAL